METFGEKRITLYIAFWGSLIMSCVTEYEYMQVLWLVGAVLFAFIYWIYNTPSPHK